MHPQLPRSIAPRAFLEHRGVPRKDSQHAKTADPCISVHPICDLICNLREPANPQMLSTTQFTRSKCQVNKKVSKELSRKLSRKPSRKRRNKAGGKWREESMNFREAMKANKVSENASAQLLLPTYCCSGALTNSFPAHFQGRERRQAGALLLVGAASKMTLS